MPTTPNSRPALERWLALLAPYWAFNMTLVWNRRVSWPEFGYTDSEKAELKSISEKCPRAEYYAWLALVGRFFAVADQVLPDRPTTAHYFHKLRFQISRVIPMLSPAVTAMSPAYFLMALEEH